jgi:hypothetical protein
VDELVRSLNRRRIFALARCSRQWIKVTVIRRNGDYFLILLRRTNWRSSSSDCNCKPHVMHTASKRPGNFTAVRRKSGKKKYHIDTPPIVHKEGEEDRWWNRYRCPWLWTSEFEFADVAVVAFIITKYLSSVSFFLGSDILFNPNTKKLRSVSWRNYILCAKLAEISRLTFFLLIIRIYVLLLIATSIRSVEKRAT